MLTVLKLTLDIIMLLHSNCYKGYNPVLELDFQCFYWNHFHSMQADNNGKRNFHFYGKSFCPNVQMVITIAFSIKDGAPLAKLYIAFCESCFCLNKKKKKKLINYIKIYIFGKEFYKSFCPKVRMVIQKHSVLRMVPRTLAKL